LAIKFESQHKLEAAARTIEPRSEQVGSQPDFSQQLLTSQAEVVQHFESDTAAQLTVFKFCINGKYWFRVALFNGITAKAVGQTNETKSEQSVEKSNISDQLWTMDSPATFSLILDWASDREHIVFDVQDDLQAEPDDTVVEVVDGVEVDGVAVTIEPEVASQQATVSLPAQQLHGAEQATDVRVESQQIDWFRTPFLMKIDVENDAKRAAAASLSSKNFLMSGSSVPQPSHLQFGDLQHLIVSVEGEQQALSTGQQSIDTLQVLR
jgi:hypothetical protein